MLALAAALASAALPRVAHAAPCWKRVTEDWTKDGSVNGKYAPTCYRKAVQHLPLDMRWYTTAGSDILDAMRQATRDRGPGRAAVRAPRVRADGNGRAPSAVAASAPAAQKTRTLASEPQAQSGVKAAERTVIAPPVAVVARRRHVPTFLLIVAAAGICIAAWAGVTVLQKRQE
jgi:hypothetical protein